MLNRLILIDDEADVVIAANVRLYLLHALNADYALEILAGVEETMLVLNSEGNWFGDIYVTLSPDGYSISSEILENVA